MSGLGIALRLGIFRKLIHHTRSRMQVEAACRTPRSPPVPCAMARSQFGTWTLGWASPRNCRTASMIFVMPPRLTGWLLHKPPPSVLKGNLPTPEMRLPSATNLPPSPFAETEIFKLHQDRDGEAVIDGSIFDVLRSYPRLFEGSRSGPHASRIGQVQRIAATRSFQRLAMSDHAHQRLLEAPGDRFRGHDQAAAAIGDDAAIQPVQRIGNHRRVEHVLDGDDVGQHRVRIVLGVVRGGDLDPGELLAGG